MMNVKGMKIVLICLAIMSFQSAYFSCETQEDCAGHFFPCDYNEMWAKGCESASYTRALDSESSEDIR